MRLTAVRENLPSMYSIVIKNSAKKEIDAIPNVQFLKIDTAILSLKTKPHPYPQSKKLKGENNRRLRIGDYRVFYAVDEKEKTITIYRVRHRKEVYR